MKTEQRLHGRRQSRAGGAEQGRGWQKHRLGLELRGWGRNPNAWSRS